MQHHQATSLPTSLFGFLPYSASLNISFGWPAPQKKLTEAARNVQPNVHIGETLLADRREAFNAEETFMQKSL